MPADTAGSAREIAKSGYTTRAAIATRWREIYKLPILAAAVEDEAHNTRVSCPGTRAEMGKERRLGP